MIRRRYRKYFQLKYILGLIFISSATTIIYTFSTKQTSAVVKANIADIVPETPTEITVHVTTTTSTNIIKPIAKPSCIPYTMPDNRPFFEREPPQLNLPGKLSNSSHQDLLHRLQSLRLYVLASARNVANNIDTFRKYIEPIVDLFHPSSRILICESDSNDDTVEKLRQWPRAQVYTYGNMGQTYPSRPERIAFCRNKLLNLTHQTTADYILMVDIDIFAGDVDAFLSNFQYNTDDWSGMTACTKDVYYDLWALRTLSDSIVNFDVWHRIAEIQRNSTYCGDSVLHNIIRVHQKQIPVNHSLIEVRSAFGGAGLYKTNATYGCQYSGADMTCEHVPFHLCIREKNHGRIFINPTFIL